MYKMKKINLVYKIKKQQQKMRKAVRWIVLKWHIFKKEGFKNLFLTVTANMWINCTSITLIIFFTPPKSIWNNQQNNRVTSFLNVVNLVAKITFNTQIADKAWLNNSKYDLTRNVFKDDKRRRINKGKTYLFINHTQMTENLK